LRGRLPAKRHRLGSGLSGRKLKFEENPSAVLLNVAAPALWHLRFFPVKTLTAPGIPRFLIINNGVGTIMKTLVLAFFRDESGATAIEYGLIAAGIAIAIITAVQGVGSKLSTNFDSISTSLK
jgi:pilus assembly protein Flp/PilA